MKKLVSTLLALSMALSVSTMAFASGFKDNSTIEVKYTQGETYEITIPSAIDITKNAQEGDVTAENVRIENAKKLVISMASANGYILDCNGSKIVYTVKIGEGAAFSGKNNPQEVLSVVSGAADENGKVGGTVKLSFAADSNEIAKATKAGAHTDILTFTCTVQNAS